jgi:hypothetical protein
VRNVSSLQLALRELMVRHRRSEITVMLPRRLAETIRVTPGAEEEGLYRAISSRVREQARDAPTARLLTLRSVQQLAGSSPWACADTLAKLGWRDLAERAARFLGSSKSGALLDLLARHRARGEKVVCSLRFAALESLHALLTNLVSRGTLEERLLEVLQAKINLFELVVGELDMILGRVADELDFETLVFRHYVDSRDEGEFVSRLEEVGEELARARVELVWI